MKRAPIMPCYRTVLYSNKGWPDERDTLAEGVRKRPTSRLSEGVIPRSDNWRTANAEKKDPRQDRGNGRLREIAPVLPRVPWRAGEPGSGANTGELPQRPLTCRLRVHLSTSAVAGLSVNFVQQEAQQRGHTIARSHDRRHPSLAAEADRSSHASVVCIQGVKAWLRAGEAAGLSTTP